MKAQRSAESAALATRALSSRATSRSSVGFGHFCSHESATCAELSGTARATPWIWAIIRSFGSSFEGAAAS